MNKPSEIERELFSKDKCIIQNMFSAVHFVGCNDRLTFS